MEEKRIGADRKDWWRGFSLNEVALGAFIFYTETSG